MMGAGFSCIVTDCKEDAFGIILVNDNKTGITIFMLPMCDTHGQQAKTREFTVILKMNDQPEVIIGEGEQKADVTLTYESI